ncbi:MAG: hypothetical protein IMY72_08460 [Bacteroidetes bacterium]|nr:hypothetical protein [Bacteroidota bacterium]
MEEILNKEILEWWHQLPDNLRGNMPTFIHPLNTNAKILFVGLNPSGDITPKPAITSFSEVEIQHKIKQEFQAIFGDGVPDRNGQYKRYYKPISSIADDLGVEFEHCDLFQMSYKTAKIIVKELIGDNGLLKPLHNKHLSVFSEILKFISPKLVITNNVITADILKGYLQLQFEDKTGLYVDKTKTYFYLNGIMSYGRQTKYDRERLLWQIKKVI